MLKGFCRVIVSSICVLSTAAFLTSASALASAPIQSSDNSQAAEMQIQQQALNSPDQIDPAFPQAFTDRTIGSDSAPLTINVYSSLSCSHCANFYLQTMPAIKKNYVDTGKVRFVIHEFPFNLVGLHAAMAGLCLPIDSYQGFTEGLYKTQASWIGSDNGENHIRQMASFAGLSPDQYAACTASKPLENKLVRDRLHATNDLKVNATPTFLFEGGLERLVGDQTYSAFAQMIEKHLSPAKTTAK